MRKIAGRFRRRLGIEATGDPAMAIPAFIDVRARTPFLASRERLSAQSKPRDERLVARLVPRLQIVEQAAALRHELQEAAA